MLQGEGRTFSQALGNPFALPSLGDWEGAGQAAFTSRWNFPSMAQ